jgi:thiol:disulfide interchange protein DsbC
MNLKHLVLMIVSTLLISSLPAFADGIDAGKSITIGSGAKTVFEFTDPDCPYCRKASKYFEGRTDVTRHVFFYPLPRHPKAKDKAQYILSQDERTKCCVSRGNVR